MDNLSNRLYTVLRLMQITSKKIPVDMINILSSEQLFGIIKMYGGTQIRIPKGSDVAKYNLFLKIIDAVVKDGGNINDFIKTHKISKYQLRSFKHFLKRYRKYASNKNNIPIVSKDVFDVFLQKFKEQGRARGNEYGVNTGGAT